ncbi:hypothetical protein DAEQUDRAFT_52818 [Daedalea quercina L-15889]|uniref:Uncharacterized protein n=1 Tax=Daedalea quercina L-15889 TaxID=1314783 RepID=A0A165L9R7_9APHY|nr:hypothetical protein DAEQUDRAFT_52818 [Daedalea quercina L-15889]
MSAQNEASPSQRDDTVIIVPSLPTEASPGHAELWKEMLVHAEAIRDLKSRWNTIASIFRLPDEVLAGVFHILSFLYYNDQLEWRFVHRYRWISVCQVCSHWRIVALGCPRLWSDITVTRSMNWMRELLARSQEVPLRVQIAMTSMVDGMDKPARLVLGELSRTEELVVGISPDAFSILNALDVPTPLLRRLTVEVMCHRTTSLPGTRIPLLQVLTRPATDQLERLHLLNCPFPWNTPVPFTSLSHLKIIGSNADRPSLTRVIATLDRLRLLESLDLEGILPALPQDVTRIPTTPTAVNLTRLKMFRLVGEPIDCADLLGRLSFPRSIHLILECTSGRGTADLVACIRSRTSLVEHPRTLVLGEDFAASTFRLRISMDEGPIRDDTRFPLIVTFKSNSSLAVSRPPSSSAIEFCLHLTLANVRTMHIVGIIPPSYDEDRMKEYLDLFSGVSNITVVSVSGLAAARLPNMLVARTWDGSDRICLTTLHRVEIEEVMFGVAETFLLKKPGQFTEQLAQSLEARSQELPRLETLVIRRSKYVDLPDIRMLEGVVKSVIWDGIVDANPGEEDYDLNYY